MVTDGVIRFNREMLVAYLQVCSLDLLLPLEFIQEMMKLFLNVAGGLNRGLYRYYNVIVIPPHLVMKAPHLFKTTDYYDHEERKLDGLAEAMRVIREDTIEKWPGNNMVARLLSELMYQSWEKGMFWKGSLRRRDIADREELRESLRPYYWSPEQEAERFIAQQEILSQQKRKEAVERKRREKELRGQQPSDSSK